MRLTTAERMEADGVVSKVHVAANKPVGPKGVHRKAMTEEADGTGLRRAADKMTVPTGWACKSGRQAGGKGRRGGAASIRAAARWRYAWI